MSGQVNLPRTPSTEKDDETTSEDERSGIEKSILIKLKGAVSAKLLARTMEHEYMMALRDYGERHGVEHLSEFITRIFSRHNEQAIVCNAH